MGAGCAGRKPILLWALSGLVVACGILTAYFLLQTDCHVTGKDEEGVDTQECSKHPMPDWLAVAGTPPQASLRLSSCQDAWQRWAAQRFLPASERSVGS